jgi:predicted DNA-binding transcriptional regulator AlpA
VFLVSEPPKPPATPTKRFVPKLSSIPPVAGTENAKARKKAGRAPSNGHDQHNRQNAHATRAPPALKLLDKRTVCEIFGLSFPTVWKEMRAGRFPRSRVIAGKTMWRSDEIWACFDNLPLRRLKGDRAPDGEAAK